MEDLIRAGALLINEEDETGDVFDEDDVDGAEKLSAVRMMKMQI